MLHQKVEKEVQKSKWDEQETNNERLKSAISIIVLNNELNTLGCQLLKTGNAARKLSSEVP